MTRRRELAAAVGVSVLIVLVVGGFTWFAMEWGCTGDDTQPQPPLGSSARHFCDAHPYGLYPILAATVTLACGWVATEWRAGWLAFLGLVIGVAIAIAPWLVRGTDRCPGGTRAIAGACVPHA